MAYQVFISHTERDVEYCDIFDRGCARAGMRAFRSEFETIEARSVENNKRGDGKILCHVFVNRQRIGTISRIL